MLTPSIRTWFSVKFLKYWLLEFWKPENLVLDKPMNLIIDLAHRCKVIYIYIYIYIAVSHLAFYYLIVKRMLSFVDFNIVCSGILLLCGLFFVSFWKEALLFTILVSAGRSGSLLLNWSQYNDATGYASSIIGKN